MHILVTRLQVNDPLTDFDAWLLKTQGLAQSSDPVFKF